MSKFIQFTYSLIKEPRQFQLGKYKIPFTVLFSLLVASLLIVLSTVSMDRAKATYVRNGDFQIAISASSRYLYEGDNFNLVVNLKNTSAQTQFVRFSGGCQATYQILDKFDRVVFPATADEIQCNNAGYEEFLIVSNQIKPYYFSFINRRPEARRSDATKAEGAILPAGKYKLVGNIDGFGVTEAVEIEFFVRPKVTAGEGELCEGVGFTKKCEQGLECRHRGGFPDGAGMCFRVDDNFQPVNRCESGVGRCFDDIRGHYAENIVEKYVLQGKIGGITDREFFPEEQIKSGDFVGLVERITGKAMDPELVKEMEVGFGVRRDRAVMILYRHFFGNERVLSLKDAPFSDIGESEFKNYIIRSFNIGVLFMEKDREFRPFDLMTRAEAVVLVDRFQMLR